MFPRLVTEEEERSRLMAHVKDYQKQVHDLKSALNDLGIENQKLQVRQKLSEHHRSMAHAQYTGYRPCLCFCGV